MAEIGRDIDPMAAQQLADYSYVDDNLMGGAPEDVERMRGARVDGKYTGTVSRILAKGAMEVKFMAVSGSPDGWEAEQLGCKTLGVLYRLEEDEIYFVLRPGYYASKQKSSDLVREIVLLDQLQVDELGAVHGGAVRRHLCGVDGRQGCSSSSGSSWKMSRGASSRDDNSKGRVASPRRSPSSPINCDPSLPLPVPDGDSLHRLNVFTGRFAKVDRHAPPLLR